MSSATREQKRLLYEQLIGDQIDDKYTITGLLGFGGMGAVYEAIQSPMDRKVALKLIPTHDPTAAARFEREAYTVSKLSHPNTVTVFDFGQTGDGHLYLAMEHLRGSTLTELIREQSPLPPARVVHIGEQICRSLGEAHRAGIIHRDIKPDNIFLIEVDGDPDYVKVLDFGIAKAVHGEDDVDLTAEGRIVGTPRYMSPEQILAQPVDHRSDLYSLGCILFQMVCGTPPFDQQSTAALMMSHAQQAPPTFAERLSDEQLDGLPTGLEAVVRRTMAKHPDSRPRTTDALREELNQALRINAAYESPPSTGEHTRRAVPHPTGPQPAPGWAPGGQTGGFDQHTGDFSRQTGDFSNQHPDAPSAGSTEAELQRDLELARGEPSRGLIAGAVLLLLLFSAGGAYLLFGPEPQAEGDDAATSQDDALTHTRLVTSPPGAEILHEGQVVGTTPHTLKLDPEAAPRLYRFSLEGYQDNAVEIDPAHPQRSYVRALQPAPAGEEQADSTDEEADDPADDERASPEERRARARQRAARRAVRRRARKLREQREAPEPKQEEPATETGEAGEAGEAGEPKPGEEPGDPEPAPEPNPIVPILEDDNESTHGVDLLED